MSGLFDLTGRTALLTGSTRGLGFAMAEALAGAGATVVINGRTEQSVGKAVDALKARGLACDGAPFDAADAATARRGVEEVIARLAASTSSSRMPASRAAGRSRTGPRRTGTR